jgi:hypothetical protein
MPDLKSFTPFIDFYRNINLILKIPEDKIVAGIFLALEAA